MKSALKLSALLLSLTLASGIAVAHDHSDKHKSCYQAENLATRLQLDANQTKKLDALMTKHRAAKDKLRDAHEKIHEQERAERQKLWDEQRKDIAALLTPQQLAEFDKMPQAKQHRHRHHH